MTENRRRARQRKNTSNDDQSRKQREQAISQHAQNHRHDVMHDHDHENEPNVFHLFMIFNVFVGAFLYGVYYCVQTPWFMQTCTADQPLVDIQDDFLPKTTFAELRDCLANHPLSNELDDNNFNGTHGFVINFSAEGVPDFREHRHFACLVPYFNTVRLPQSNAFVVNLLTCELASGVEDKAGNRIAVGTHIDNTVAIRSWRTFLAHQVNVLYALIPADMKGGDLQVFPFENGRPKDNDPPVRQVFPRTNRMVAFKGNAYHRVMSFKTTTNETRVSLVIEQYNVPESYKSRLTRFSFERRRNHHDMNTGTSRVSKRNVRNQGC